MIGGRIHDASARAAGEVHLGDLGPVDGASRFVSPLSKHLYGWWASAGGGRLPMRRAFDITEHPRLIPHLYLLAVLPGPRFQIRLMGEHVVRHVGINDTRRFIGERPDRAHDQDFAVYFRRVHDGRQCRHRRGDLGNLKRDFVRYEAVDCPLTDDGESVSAILGLLVRI